MKEGDPECLARFLPRGRRRYGQQAFNALPQIVEFNMDDRERIRRESDHAGSALCTHDQQQQNVYTTNNQAVQQAGLSNSTVNAAITNLERLGIV